jgi:hypothetical protein
VTECTAIIGRCRLTVGVLRRAKGALRGRKSDSRAALRPRVSVNNLIAVECINGLFDRCRNVRRGPRRGGGRANFGRTGGGGVGCRSEGANRRGPPAREISN